MNRHLVIAPRPMFAALITVFLSLATATAFAADGASPAVAPPSAPGLVALDIVVLPGASVRQQAEQANDVLVAAFPEGFAFGDDYVPHTSLLQIYAEKDQVAQIEDIIGMVLKENEVSARGLALSTEAEIQQGLSIPDSEPPVYAPKLAITPSKGVANLQGALIAALSPYMKTGGTEAAFLVSDADRAAAARLNLPVILPLGMKLVDEYVAKESGRRFAPHITLGLADPAAWRKLSERPFFPVTADSPAVALCLLGPYDSCHKIKRSFPLR